MSYFSSKADQKYDVFLSFRGSDTRRAFTAHLHKALEGANLKTFLDSQEIETGLSLKPELESAIKASRASVIVLSKNHAASTWCLEELVLILEQQRNFEHIVIPIFYHVEPSDVRKQQNSFGEAMAEHKKKMEAETNKEKRSQWAIKIQKWEKALTQVADLKGEDVKNYKLETEFIEEIVNDIHHKIRIPIRTSSSMPQLIGMEDSIRTITSWLKDGSSHKADILTILGMGGIGKTSLARHVYGLHCHAFGGSSFVENISRSKENINGLLDYQRQLYNDISLIRSNQVRYDYEYTSAIENGLASKKVFLVLDDIDSPDQLNALLGNKGFHPGSKIIVTTRDAWLTESCLLFKAIEPKHITHFLRGLNETASLRLLCFHAFKSEEVKEGYEEVSDDIVKFCDGHPLALEVLGGCLYNREVAYCEDRIKELREEPGFFADMDIRVNNALRMSIVSLSKNDKELLKYIACFFVGEDRDYAETILKACDIKTSSGITNLIDRCLLHIRWRNQLTMHSLIQKMGRDEVDKESPDPEMRSLLWRHQDSYKVLKRKKGTEKVKGLALDMRMIEKEKLRGSLFELEMDALSKMDNLKLLQLNLVQLNGSFKNFPLKLRWLCMRRSPLESFPSDLPMKKLVALDLSYSNIKSFDISCSNPQRHGKRQKLIGSSSKDEKLLGSLKILDLSYCDQLQSLGGFRELPALGRLYLRNCKSLVNVCETIGQCHELVFIDLNHCDMCSKFLRSLKNLESIKTLLLDGCNLGELPSNTKDVNSMKTVDANSVGITSPRFSSTSVEAIPRKFKSLLSSLPKSLVMLSLPSNNLSDKSFPMDFSCLTMLKGLNLDGNPISSMPKCVESLPGLEILSMRKCNMLTSIKHPPRTLKVLYASGFWTDQAFKTLREVVFHQEMSRHQLLVGFSNSAYSSYEVQDPVKIQTMAGVKEKVLHGLGWCNLDFIMKRRVGTYHYARGLEGSQTKMYYEFGTFGIFGTMYRGKVMPNWIRHRSKGSPISFNIRSSRKKQLRGLKFCYVQSRKPSEKTFRCPIYQSFLSPMIKVSNITKNRTWIYKDRAEGVNVGEKWITFVSHWVFGMNDMEAGDEVYIAIITDQLEKYTKECGVSLVYEDGSMEEEEEEDT